MKTDAIVAAISDIQEAYIVEYGQLTEKSKAKGGIRRWLLYAACLAIVLGLSAIVVKVFPLSQGDTLRDGELYSFESYSEMCNILPGYHIFQQIPTAESSSVICLGYQREDNQTAPDLPAGPIYGYETYRSLEIIMTLPNSVEYNILCEVGVTMSMDEYVLTRKPFAEANQNIFVENIYGHEIWYEQRNESGNSTEAYTAVFTDKGDFFIVSFNAVDKVDFLNHLEILLKK